MWKHLLGVRLKRASVLVTLQFNQVTLRRYVSYAKNHLDSESDFLLDLGPFLPLALLFLAETCQ